MQTVDIFIAFYLNIAFVFFYCFFFSSIEGLYLKQIRICILSFIIIVTVFFFRASRRQKHVRDSSIFKAMLQTLIFNGCISFHKNYLQRNYNLLRKLCT